MYNGRFLSQLCISTERFECLIHVLELRRGFFLSLTLSDTPHYQNVPFEIPDNWVSVPVSELFYLNPKSEIADNIHIGFIPMACVDDGFSGNHYFEKRIWKEVKKGYCHFQNGAHRYCKNISML